LHCLIAREIAAPSIAILSTPRQVLFGRDSLHILNALKLPNFILAGAPTSGTTSLYHYLSQHPDVYMSPIKEPTYFAAADMLSRDDFSQGIKRHQTAIKAYLAGPMTQPARFWLTEWEDYLSLFRNVSDQKAIGEASVSYFWLPSAASAIRAKLPGVRLIFMLRDPAERLFSWYLQTLRENPRVTFRDRILEEMRVADKGRPGLLRQLDGGLYATHLNRFFGHFPRDQIRVYLYESYRRDAPAVLRDIFSFLGVAPNQPIDLSQRHNETVVPRFPAIDRLRHRIFGDLSFVAWLPATARRSLREFYNRRSGKFEMAPDDRKMAIDYYRDEILRTQDLIGRDLSAWLR
jgi:hypothetical protein